MISNDSESRHIRQVQFQPHIIFDAHVWMQVWLSRQGRIVGVSLHLHTQPQAGLTGCLEPQHL